MRWLFLLFIFCSFSVHAQDDLLGKEYIKNGEFEKALVVYKKLYQKKPSNSYYVSQLVIAHQELEHYKEAETLILKRLERSKYPPLLVELGYNYQLQKDSTNAKKAFNKAIESLNDNPNFGGIVGRKFENYSLFEEAISTYTTTMQLKPELNFNMQLARIYGSQGDIAKMFKSYLDFALRQDNYRPSVKRLIGDFITENGDDENNILLRKILLKRIQSQPDLYWSDMLSWLFIQQKDFNKAFAQEKALFRRDGTQDLTRLVNLGNSVKNEKAYEQSISIFTYVMEQTQEPALILYANQSVLEIKTEIATPKEYKAIAKAYEDIITHLWRHS